MVPRANLPDDVTEIRSRSTGEVFAMRVPNEIEETDAIKAWLTAKNVMFEVTDREDVGLRVKVKMTDEPFVDYSKFIYAGPGQWICVYDDRRRLSFTHEAFLDHHNLMRGC